MKLKDEDIIEIAKLVDDGWSYKKIAPKFGICNSVVYRLIKRYKSHGLNAVLHKEHKTYTIDEKIKIINRFYAGESISSLSAEINVADTLVSKWVLKYEKLGYNGLIDNRGRPGETKMGSDIRKNMGWIVNDEKGGLEITINLSKPEKSNSDVKKALSAAPKYPKCVICPENMGYAGHGTTRQNLRGHNMILGGDPWFWQFSPYAYFNEHGIAINASHTPMVVEEKNITNVLDFIDYVPEYFIGFNAALPIIGGSILAHDHYQGGRYTLPVFKSKDKYLFTAKTHPNVKISILNWYNNVIRLESTSRTEIEAVAQQIVRTWKSYDDVENNIIARTNVQHSSITCISRYDNKYIVDLILRNNVTSEEYPDGVYHAHPEYHNIKKEAIGLIEAGGMFILPARLKRQLAIVSDCLQVNELNLDLLQEDMLVHKDMIQRLVDNHGIGLSEDKANNVIKLEIERICREILYNTAVYKDTEAGNKGFIKFMNSNDFKLV